MVIQGILLIYFDREKEKKSEKMWPISSGGGGGTKKDFFSGSPNSIVWKGGSNTAPHLYIYSAYIIVSNFEYVTFSVLPSPYQSSLYLFKRLLVLYILFSSSRTET